MLRAVLQSRDMGVLQYKDRTVLMNKNRTESTLPLKGVKGVYAGPEGALEITELRKPAII